MARKNGTSSPGASWENGIIDNNHQGTFHMELNEASSDFDSDGTPCVEEVCVRKIVNNWAVLPSRRATTIDAKTWGKTLKRNTTRQRSTRKLRISQSFPRSAFDIEMAPTSADEDMADEEETWNKLQLIRTLPVDMKVKRKLKAEVSRTPTFRMRGLNLLTFRRRQLWGKLLRSLTQNLSIFTPWKSSIRAIEANFGTGVASYFLLIRWLLLLNLVITGFVVVFMIIPWELGKESCSNFKLNTTEFIKPILQGCSGNSSDCDENCVSESDDCWNHFRNSVLTTKFNHSSYPLKIIQDFVQGTGWLELSPAFYGFYQPAFIPWGKGRIYNVALGYAMTVIFVLLFSLACISKSVASGFKDNILIGRAYLHQFSDLVFTSWDYCIDSGKIAGIKKKNIANAIKVALEEKAHKEEKSSRTTCFKIRLFFIRIAINLLVIATLSLACYIIFRVITLGNGKNDIMTFIYDFLPPVVITILNFLVPIFFRILASWERHSATCEIKRTLYRTILLRLFSVLVLILTLYMKLDTRSKDSDESCTHDDLSMCWENYVGQQLYRLCIFDLALALFGILLWELPSVLILRRYILPDSRFNYLAYPEFDLVNSTLNLVYGQTICWLGMFYCPILPMINAIKCIIVFYTKYLSLTVYASPPSRLYGASSSTSLFMNVMFVSFIFCALPLGYHFTSLKPSSSCGPYRGHPSVLSVVLNEVALLPEDGTLRKILSFFGSAGFYVPAILLLLAALYYFRSKSVAQQAISESLAQQLILESEDKEFLLSRLAAATESCIQKNTPLH